MIYGSVCSGIEAATVAWHGLGWAPAWFSEIEPFPAAVLAHHYPHVPNLGDMTKIAVRILRGEVEAPDVLVGGTPCQAFSVAGLRNSLDDERGNLTLRYVELADAIDHVRVAQGHFPCIAAWENVPGVLSTKDNAFGCFLAGLAGEDEPLQPAGKGWSHAGAVYGPKRAIAWRTLDAQYFGLAQRRRRVFVVASARNGFDPAQVLFEWDGLRRDTAPSREAGEGAAVCPTLRAGGNSTGGDRPPGTDVDTADSLIPVYAIQAGALRANPASGPDGVGVQEDHAYTLEARAEVQCVAFGGGNTSGPIDVAACLTAKGNRQDFEVEKFAVQPVVAVHGTQDPCVSTTTAFALGRNNGGENVVAFDPTQVTSAANYSNPKSGDPCHPLAAGAHAPAVAVSLRGREGGATAELGDEVGNCLRASGGGGDKAHVLAAMQVRRLTPRECERLQGFPDEYTMIPWRKRTASECPDGPRYKALGNSMAVPCMRWIGRRIQQHENCGGCHG